MADFDFAARVSAGGADRDPDRVVAEIVAGPQFQENLNGLAAQLGRPRPDLEREARAALHEMVAVQSELALGAIDRLARFALRAYDIEVDTGALDSLRTLNRQHALVFLPSHKSYLDPFILRGALGRAGLPCNHVLGGVNVSFWPMGPVLRRSGIVFIRRSIRDDAVYKVALRAYLGHLVERRYNLEWYLEGGRSRTGKLRPPRLGVLSYLVEAFRERGVDDVFLVPVSIAYDQLQEVAAMAAEEHGAEKKAESLAWMLKYIRSQGQKLGKAYLNFAEPVSLRQVRTERKLVPGNTQVGKIAFEVLHRINRVTPITPTSLLTLALLGLGDRALTPAEIRSVLDPLLDYVAVRKLPQAGTVDLAAPGGLQPALDALVSTKVVTRFAGGAEPVYGIGENQHLVAAYTRNRIIHFFVTRAITELVLLHLIRRPVGHPEARGTGGAPPTGAAGAAKVRGGFFQSVDGAPAEGYRSPRREGAVGLSVAQPGEGPAVILDGRESKMNAGRGEVALLTGEYGARVLKPVLPALAEAAGRPVRALPVPNHLFGGNIAVTGLLAGEDVAAVLEGEPPSGVRYLLPDVTLSRGVFLDGGKPPDLPRPVEVIGTGGDALVEALRS